MRLADKWSAPTICLRVGRGRTAGAFCARRFYFTQYLVERSNAAVTVTPHRAVKPMYVNVWKEIVNGSPMKRYWPNPVSKNRLTR